MVIKTFRDPYDAGFSVTRPRFVELNPGLTVLVGCNGAGKTTFLRNVQEYALENHIPVHSYNNLSDGGHRHIFDGLISGIKEFEGDDMSLGVTMFNASEGETIKLNLRRQGSLYKKFFETGVADTSQVRFSRAFGHKDDEYDTNIRVLLFDATDSGASIDSICDIKNVFHSLLGYASEHNIELYIVIAANEYELCANEQCFDVTNGKYLTFSTYESYRTFILKSRAKKEKRIEKQQKWLENREKKRKSR